MRPDGRQPRRGYRTTGRQTVPGREVEPAIRLIRRLGTDDRGSPLSPETVYNIIFGDNPGWIILRLTNDTALVVFAPDGSPFEVR